MLINLIFHILLFSNQTKSYLLDYTSANKNVKVYDQVPRNELIWSKFQAYEPLYFSDSPNRGKGIIEPLVNQFILSLRSEKIPVYVDYFTVAKGIFYRGSIGYESCGQINRDGHHYRKLIHQNKKNKFQFLNGKSHLFSIPYAFFPSIGVVGFQPKKQHLFAKHLWPQTQVYNVKSLLNDPELYTVQVTGMASTIKEFIYLDQNTVHMLKPEFKKRVYDFVASNAYQIPLMLQGKRMDWVDLSIWSDFYVKQLKIPSEAIILAPLSNTDPNLQTINDIKLAFLECVGKDLTKLKKTISIINKTIKKLRTDVEFWKAVLKQYALDMNLPYTAPEDFYYTKTMVNLKKEIDRGDFDEFNE